MIKEYIKLTKPGIVRGNLLVVIASYLFGSVNNFSFSTFIGLIVGSAFVIGASCVANNVLDKNIDLKMKRTKLRAVASGKIKPQNALIYASILMLAGLLSLGLFTNAMTAYLGVLAAVLYVAVYGYFKRRSVHGTLIGAIPGAIPPVAGYTAATNQLDLISLAFFIVLIAWQMAHFYAIAILRLKEYKKAKLPMMPNIYGVQITKIQILAYIAIYIFFSVFLYSFKDLGIVYLITTTAVNVWWVKIAFEGLLEDSEKLNKKWAGSMFGWSLVVLTVFSLNLIIYPLTA